MFACTLVQYCMQITPLHIAHYFSIG